VGAGKHGVTLETSPQVGGMAELDRPGRELLSLTRAIQVAEATRKVPGVRALVKLDP
jgi:hypothetical protein